MRAQVDDHGGAARPGERTRQQFEVRLVADIGALVAPDLAAFGGLDALDAIFDFLGHHRAGQHAGDFLMHADRETVDVVDHGVLALDRRHKTLHRRRLLAAVRAERLDEPRFEFAGRPVKPFLAQENTQIFDPHR